MLYIGADHGGFPLKEKIKAWLATSKIDFEDVGAHTLDPEDDYPEFAFKVAQKVAEGPASAKAMADEAGIMTIEDWREAPKGILLCRSSGGVVIAANKVYGVRAVSVHDVKEVVHAREHNDANIIAIAGDWTSEDEAKKIVETFLKTKFQRENRHLRRLQQIQLYEDQFCGKNEEKSEGCCGGGCGGHC